MVKPYFMKKYISSLLSGILLLAPLCAQAQLGRFPGKPRRNISFEPHNKASFGHRTITTKKTVSEIGKLYGNSELGNLMARHFANKHTLGVTAAHVLQMQNSLRKGKFSKGWHAAVQYSLPMEYKADLPLSYAEDVLLGRLQLEDLLPQEKEIFFLAQFPALALEENLIPTDSQWGAAFAYYHDVLFDKIPQQQPVDELDVWAKKMAAVTNVGLLGDAQFAPWIAHAAETEFPPQLRPLTDLILMRSLLTLHNEKALEYFVNFRLQEVDKKGRPIMLPVVWNDFPDTVLNKIPPGRIMPPPSAKAVPKKRTGPGRPRCTEAVCMEYEKLLPNAVQYVLGKYNPYNLLHLDSSLDMTVLFMSLQQGMLEKFSDVVMQQTGNLETLLLYRLGRSYAHAHLFAGLGILPALFPFASESWNSWSVKGEVEELYPNAAGFLTDELLPLYMLVKHNLEVRRWWPRIQHWQKYILALEQHLSSIQVKVNHPPQDDMRWLAEQITPQTQYVLVGDVSGAMSYLRDVFDLARYLRQRFPNREIILLSQNGFGLPRGSIDKDVYDAFGDSPVFEYLVQCEENGLLAERVRDLYIQTEELDDPFKDMESGEMSYIVTPLEPTAPLKGEQVQLFSQTFEGLRLISEAYKDQIGKLRYEHPDALFVVAADADRIDYAAPYSLGQSLADQGTYVALLGTQRDITDKGAKRSLFEQTVFAMAVTRGLSQGTLNQNGEGYVPFISDRILQFNKRMLKLGKQPMGPLGQFIGFDVRINRPEH